MVCFKSSEPTGPMKPRRDVRVKGLSLMGAPDDVTGMVWKQNNKNILVEFTMLSSPYFIYLFLGKHQNMTVLPQSEKKI